MCKTRTKVTHGSSAQPRLSSPSRTIAAPHRSPWLTGPCNQARMGPPWPPKPDFTCPATRERAKREDFTWNATKRRTSNPARAPMTHAHARACAASASAIIGGPDSSRDAASPATRNGPTIGRSSISPSWSRRRRCSGARQRHGRPRSAQMPLARAGRAWIALA